MKYHLICLFLVLFVIIVWGGYLIASFNEKPPETMILGAKRIGVKTIQCNSNLWDYVYTGDPRKFQKPQDRLKIIKDCVSVTGVIKTALKEADGDWHLRLDLDSQFKNMLNQKNIAGQQGMLVLEPVCENVVIQKDTLQEGVCNNYKGHIFDKNMVGKRVEVIGPYVEDKEHGWHEIHPVNLINVVK